MLAQCKFLIGWYTQNLSADWLSEHDREIINFSVPKCSVYGKEKGLILAGNGNVMSLNGNKN